MELNKLWKSVKDYKNIFMVLGYFLAIVGLTALIWSNDRLAGLVLLVVNLVIALVFTPFKNRKSKLPELRVPRSAFMLYGGFLLITSIFLIFGKGPHQPQAQGIITFVIGGVLLYLSTPKGDFSPSDFKD
jgi:membrane protease YdiL (CAAX protease family)